MSRGRAEKQHIYLLSSERYVCSFVCSFVRLFVCSFVRLFVCSFVRLFVCSFVRLFVCSFVRLFVCSFVRLIRLFDCSFVRLFVCSFVLCAKSFTRTVRYADRTCNRNVDHVSEHNAVLQQLDVCAVHRWGKIERSRLIFCRDFHSNLFSVTDRVTQRSFATVLHFELSSRPQTAVKRSLRSVQSAGVCDVDERCDVFVNADISDHATC